MSTTRLIDRQGHIAPNLRCAGCGYNLRGLEPASACPECGEAVEQAIETWVNTPVWTRPRRRVAVGFPLAAAGLAAANVLAVALADARPAHGVFVLAWSLYVSVSIATAFELRYLDRVSSWLVLAPLAGTLLAIAALVWNIGGAM
ncbi:MAG: hypothetical protein ACYTG1_00975 [Planctomycetota bacterium]|jgi:hypothetical protein